MRLTLFSWVFLIAIPAFADLFIEGINTVSAPMQYVVCAGFNTIKLIKTKTSKSEPSFQLCPKGFNILGYILLRQITQKLASRYGSVYPNEILLNINPNSAELGKTLVINLMGKAPSDISRYEGLQNAEIITPKSEEELNSYLSKISPQSLDLIAIDTHCSAFFGDKRVTAVDIDKLKNFDLLKDSGKVAHFGCESMSNCNLDRTLELVKKLSPKDVLVFGSEASVVGLSLNSRIASALAEFVSKPAEYLSSIVCHNASNRGRKRVLSVNSSCKVQLQ